MTEKDFRPSPWDFIWLWNIFTCVYFEHYWRKIAVPKLPISVEMNLGGCTYLIIFEPKKLNFDGILQAKSYVLGCWKFHTIFFSSIHTLFTPPIIEIKKKVFDSPRKYGSSNIQKLSGKVHFNIFLSFVFL